MSEQPTRGPCSAGMTAVGRKYPKTLNVRFAMEGGAVTAPEGSLLHAGGALAHSPSLKRTAGGELDAS